MAKPCVEIGRATLAAIFKEFKILGLSLMAKPCVEIGRATLAAIFKEFKIFRF